MLIKHKSIELSLLFLFLLFCQVTVSVQAKEKEERPLIQGINEQDEFLGLLHLGMLQTAPLEQADITQAMELVAPSCVKLHAGAYYGSGTILFILDDSVVIATNKHVIASDTQVGVTFFEQTQVEGSVLGISQQYDIAFVTVACDNLPLSVLKAIRYVNTERTQQNEITYGDEIFLCGSIDGVAENRVEGTIINPKEYFVEFQTELIHSYCRVKSGMSGCGTFDGYGNYIGMLCGGLEEDAVSIPVSLVLKEYENL